MAQAKGILPRGQDREVLYKSPRTCGYFIGVKLSASLDEAGVRSWLERASGLVDVLVTRLDPKQGQEKGEKVAAVAVGFGRSFFVSNEVPRFPSVEPPLWFVPGMPLPSVSGPLAAVAEIDADVLFYVAATFEARVNVFINELAAMKPEVEAVTLERGYQREDGTEPFGYADGLRNIRTEDRSRFVFVHRDGQEPDEPAWADGGSYMAYMKIVQHPDQFAVLADDAARDATMGRTKDGTRLDLVGQKIDARHESPDVPVNLPPTAHVRKAGPRGGHDDTQIFRRGLPFVEATPEGSVRIGLNFCSFQASLPQFDVVFNDWMMSHQFPQQPGGGDAGPDALLDPARGLTTIEKFGFYFVPPYSEEGLAAAVFAEHVERKHETGQLVVHKRVTDPSDPSRRFERGGFRFQVVDAQGQPIASSEFSMDSTGRGICPIELRLGQSYALQELSSPVPNVQLASTPFTMDKRNQQLQITNQVTQPGTPYGS